MILTMSQVVNAQHAVTKITYPNARGDNDIRQEYFVELLDLALKHSEAQYGPYELVISKTALPSPRVPRMMLVSDFVSVMSSPETEFLNNTLLKVPVPLLMGIQGLRLSFIHKDNAQLFDGMPDIKSLAPLIFGQGIGWIDTKILEDNGLRVQTAAIYDSLFGLVSQKRIHAFPRGINEIYRELDAWQNEYPDLAVDQHIALYYPLPVNFYVSPKNEALKERLLLGLNNAKNSGEFDRLFEQYFSDVIERANINSRHVLILDNPYSPSQFPPQSERHLLPAIRNLVEK